MRSRALLLLSFVTASLAAPGCTASKAMGRAVGSFFDAPKPVNKERHPARPDARLAVVWVGHATALVQIGDKVVLTDPVFTSTVGQLSRRLVEPGIDPEDLPPVDAVVVSHMHFDHLSLGSLEKIEGKVRTLLLPTGGTAYLTDFGFPVVELRPFQSWEKDGLRVTAVPVTHVGWRYGLDAAWADRSFTGYVIEHDGVKVYFGGDTGYDQKIFVETALRFPDIDLALLPIAPIEPRELMRRTHLDPFEAVQAFVDLKARWMVPIHYDTFVNSFDPPGAALREMEKAKRRWKLEEGREIAVLPVGQRRVLIPKEGLPPAPAPPPVAEPPPRGAAPPPAVEEPPRQDESDIPDDDRLD